MLGVKFYGEIEFWMSMIKIITIVGLLILLMVIDLGGAPTNDRLGFRYWLGKYNLFPLEWATLQFRNWYSGLLVDPGAFNQLYDIPGTFGQFCAFWSVFLNAAFSYGGGKFDLSFPAQFRGCLLTSLSRLFSLVEVIALTAAESVNPHITIPRAVRTVFWRILIFYVGGMFVIGLTVPSDNLDLLDASGTGAASPFVIAISLAGINVLPSIINTV